MPTNAATLIGRYKFILTYLLDMPAPTKEDLEGYRIYVVFVEKIDSSVYVYVSSRIATSPNSRPRRLGLRARLFGYE